MRSRILTITGASVLAVAVGVAMSSGATAGSGMQTHAKSTTHGSSAKTQATCYNQADNDNGNQTSFLVDNTALTVTQ